MNRRQLLWTAGGAGLALSGLGVPGLAFGRETTDSPEAIARDAWIYGLPLIEMATTRARHLKGGARINRFNGGRALATHENRNVTTPNNDTLYLSAWLDLSKGPVTLTIPALGERYWSVAVMDMFTNNNIVLGTRTVGGEGGVFTLIGPRQEMVGDNPIRIATPTAWVLARVLVDGPDEVPTVQALLKGFKLSGPEISEAPPVYATRDADPKAYFASVSELMSLNWPPYTDLKLIRRAGGLLGINGEGAESAATLAGVEAARKLVRGGWGREPSVDGWTYPRASLGDFGQDYVYRAAIALGGLAALPRAEATYLRIQGEKDGLLTGDGLYRLSLPAQVPVKAFWSLSMYEATPDGQFFFTANPLNRYAIGDRTKGLKRRADGGVDIWVGRSDPGGERTSNWLPAPATGPFTVSWRAYLPDEPLLNGTWRLPPLQKV